MGSENKNRKSYGSLKRNLDCTLKKLVEEQSSELMLKGYEVNNCMYIRKPSRLLRSLMKSILVFLWQLQFKRCKAFDGDLRKMENYGIIGACNKKSRHIEVVIRVKFVYEYDRDVVDLDQCMKEDREAVFAVICDLLKIDEGEHISGTLRFKKLYESFIEEPSEDQIIEIIEQINKLELEAVCIPFEES